MLPENLDAEMFRRLEQTLHRPESESARQKVSELLAEDFVEFGATGGIYDKKVVVDVLAQGAPMNTPRAPKVSDFKVKLVSSDAVLVTYLCHSLPTAVSKGRLTLRSSIWKMIDGQWQLLFHQGTVIP